MKDRAQRQPVLFIGHGAPTLALDRQKGEPLRSWGKALGKPQALLVVSAHWEQAPVTLGTTQTSPLVYDFYGFPKPLYEVQYPAPGAPELAARVESLLADAQVRREPARGLDHGVWTPLLHLYPDGDVPVLQLSMPSSLGAQAVFELGQRLAPLRDEGVLLAGSGNITHNLRAMGPETSAPAEFARELDEWAREVLERRDVDELLAYRDKAPAFRQNHPTEDHWLPLIFAVGAGPTDPTRFPIEGFEYQNLSRRAVQIG